MDLVGGLTAVRLAIDIGKDLRSIDRSVDEATYKLKLADLSSALADAQMALSEAKLRLGQLEMELDSLRDGTLCPVCRKGRLKVISVEPHGYSNFEFHTCKCDEPSCSYQTTKGYDPSHGVYANKSM